MTLTDLENVRLETVDEEEGVLSAHPDPLQRIVLGGCCYCWQQRWAARLDVVEFSQNSQNESDLLGDSDAGGTW